MQHLGWYNQSKPHSCLAQQTPDEAYAVMLPTRKLAACESAKTPLKNLGLLCKRMGPLLSTAMTTPRRNFTCMARLQVPTFA